MGRLLAKATTVNGVTSVSDAFSNCSAVTSRH